MKIYSVDFEPIWPVSSCLIIAAKDLKEATKIAKETLTHTSEFKIKEIDITESRIIIYLNGDY